MAERERFKKGIPQGASIKGFRAALFRGCGLVAGVIRQPTGRNALGEARTNILFESMGKPDQFCVLLFAGSIRQISEYIGHIKDEETLQLNRTLAFVIGIG